MNLKKHKKHVQVVLVKLQEAGIQANVNKCEFHMTETKYLRLIISTEDIKMDPTKVEAIRTWNILTNVREMQSFIRFCNFYCRFLQELFKIAGLLNALTKKKDSKEILVVNC